MLNNSFDFAIFPGSFNPFHDGHEFVYNEAKKIFKIIFLVKALNPLKINNKKRISNYNHSFIETNDMIINICKKLNIYNIIRGYRNLKEYLFEWELCLSYRYLEPKIKFYLISSKKSLMHLSSSKLRD